MVIYFGADHRGAALKDQVLQFTKSLGYEVFDVHPQASPEDDYPDIASIVAKKVAEDPANGRGVVVCASGAGVDITANKVKGIRCALGLSTDQVFDARHDDDVNVLAFASDFQDAEQAGAMMKVFLSTPFAGEERFVRRLKKIHDIEDWPRIM